MADNRSSASVVIVDPAKAAAERDRLARAQLEDAVSSEKSLFATEGLELTVPYKLKVVVDGKDVDRVKELASTILAESFGLCDKHLNSFNPGSEVSLVNSLPVGKVHTMSEPLAAVMVCCMRVYNSSAGCFDPAVGPILSRLREAMQAGQEVPEDEVATLAAASTLANGFDLRKARGAIARKHPLAHLDLGGVSKGWTVDYVVNKFVAAGFSNVFFDWGGDCRGNGMNARDQPWVVGIVRPPALEDLNNFKNGELPMLRVVHLDHESLATSGDYMNLVANAKKGNRLYTSILESSSKKLLKPGATRLSQVSVKCDSCMYADALATAALVKADPVRVRYMLENWRFVANAVTDYTTYTRDGERVARMHEIATESSTMRDKRIAGSLPSRIVVVGGGLAGQSAAIEAASCGAHVILIEKAAKLGGNSAKATSGINAWGTRPQSRQSVPDSGKFFERDTFKSGAGGLCDPCLVKTLSVKSSEAIKWLTSFGIPLTVLSQLGGHSRKRTHRAPDQADGTPVPIGYTIMQHLEKYIRTNLSRQVTILTETSVTDLSYEKEEFPDGTCRVRVTGVEIQQKDASKMLVSADAVILATGGFSNDQTSSSLLREYAPQLFGRPTTNGPFATGDGVKMARKIGAMLVDMDKVQLHPTGLINPKDPASKTKFLGPEALRGSGGILLNKQGERFVNELDLRSVVSAAINEQQCEYPESDGSMFAYCLLNEDARKLFGLNSHTFYWKNLGLFQKAEAVEDLAKLIGCNLDRLQQTLEEYERTSKKGNGNCALTGKGVFPCVIGPQGPFYVACVTPSIHYTMGGCLISTAAEIQSQRVGSGLFGSRRPIQGLFGAGEVTGGVHGRNRLGGNSLLECVVFGRIAGDRAGTILQKRPTALSFTDWTTVVMREYREGEEFGNGSRLLTFNFPGSLQTSGLQVGHFIGIRGEWDGQQLIGYYSPVTLPDERGSISILARSDKGNLREWISAMRPGDAVEMKACGGLTIQRMPKLKQFVFRKNVIRRFGLIAGGTGVAPMLQIIRAALKKPYIDTIQSVNLVYAAEDASELSYRGMLQHYQKDLQEKLKCTFVLNNPPSGWTGGVGFVDANILRTGIPAPANDLLIAICGPPVMQRIVKAVLVDLGHNPSLVRTVDEAPEAAKI